MKPYNFINRLYVLVSLCACTHLVCAAESPKRANVIMIVVDDLGYADMSCTGLAKDVQTPNIDKLATRGIRFTNAYATAPICNASRISLMTGCYQQRQGQYWYSGPGLHKPDIATIAEILKEQGYATGYVGKFHHGSNDKPDRRGFPLNHGFQYFYGFSGGTKHYLHHSRNYGKSMLHEGPMWVQREQQDAEGFTTELFGEKSREFIRNNKANPFYLHISFNAVHNFTHQLPLDYLKAEGLKGFPDMKPNEDYWKWRKKIGYPANPEGRHYYLGQLHFLDREIGLLMKELKDQGLVDHTAIFFVSDNGGSLVTYANNGGLKGGKYTLFEGGTRVPMIISYPKRFKTDVVSGSIVSTMDLLPTICGLTGTPEPKRLDGMDISPVLTGAGKLPASRPLFWDTIKEMSVRIGKWKLLITNQAPNPMLQIVNTPKGNFLYDLESDPGETTNRYSEHPEVAEELHLALRKWQSNLTTSKQTEHNKPDAGDGK